MDNTNTIINENCGTIRISNSHIRGSCNTIYGDYNTIEGNQNTIYGSGNKVIGNQNTVKGNSNVIKGNQNTSSGFCNSNNVKGNQNICPGFDDNAGGTMNAAYRYIDKQTFIYHPDVNKDEYVVYSTNRSNIKNNKESMNIFNNSSNNVAINTGTINFSSEPEPQFTIVPKPEEEKDENCSEESLCLICMSRRKITVCLPCMHMIYCVTCSIECQKKSKLLTCPTCRKEIKEVKRIYV